MVLNFITLLVVALSGIGILFYAFLKRRKRKDKDLPDDPEKDDPILHIRNKLFFEIPVEKILLGYFVIVTLTYLVKFILNLRIPGIDLAVLYLSGITLFLGIYKMAMSVGVVNRFHPWLLFSMVFSLVIFIAVYTGMPMGIQEFLEETREYNLTIHLLGLAMGLGGTLVVDIMFTHFMRNYSISARESVIMHLISQMIIFGIFLLILSGLALYLPAAESFNENPRFIMKMIVVLIVIINGGILNLYLTPKMKKISLVDEEKNRYEKLTRISFALGAISIVSWLSAFFLAMLKDLFSMPLFYLIIGYVVLLLITAGGSQMAKVYYEKKEEED
ncbi:hypothetical protein FHG64_13345 [Antarcticibacterium flavum]|uniref:Uncharacterized protein n=1 Tax=Antarcticibacterium flavum TaxID=2058175 RepID=A0A5B7X6D2_9FLAO|nr:MULTISPECIES: hypothetical protein [Antarcticibacterium]MCM4158564.1 hypothetical protein [Antarcticibacterium sp. W02-3]QCY70308.1 hypothetical protein FHG64_13345 [Antarcticibacterium flavum]